MPPAQGGGGSDACALAALGVVADFVVFGLREQVGVNLRVRSVDCELPPVGQYLREPARQRPNGPAVATAGQRPPAVAPCLSRANVVTTNGMDQSHE